MSEELAKDNNKLDINQDGYKSQLDKKEDDCNENKEENEKNAEEEKNDNDLTKLLDIEEFLDIYGISMLEYEKQMFLDIMYSDALVVCAK